MLISQDTMDRMHLLQFDMLKELIRVMDILNIKYFFVHGSLLGAIRDHDFVAEDDDIDIAIMRSDYNKLMLHGQSLISSEYYIQCSTKDGYPLPFAKLRKDKTAFIQPVLKNVHCHKGIYIDIFLLDYESKEAIFRLRKTLYTTRINQIFPNKRQSLKSKLVWIASLLLFPSYQNTLLKRELLFSSAPKNNYLTIHGGKSSEVNMPLEWFSASETCKFRDIDVTCPIGFQLYLKKIYGDDYMHHNPAKERIDNSMIEISADVLDFGKSYLEYE